MTPGSLSCFQMALWNFSEDSPYGAAAGTADYCGNPNVHVYTLEPPVTETPVWTGLCIFQLLERVRAIWADSWASSAEERQAVKGRKRGRRRGQQGSKEVSPITPVSP